MDYHHTQTGHLALLWSIAAAGLVAASLIGWTLSDAGGGLIIGLLAFAGALGVVLWNFNRLTASVSDGRLTLAFGWGWPRRRIALRDIEQVEVVRNRWWYGFGIRLTPHGWMYNAWGLDAVQLRLAGGKSFRIGTDEPDELAAALATSAPHLA